MEDSFSPGAINIKDRNSTIDVMRGIAVLGILLMNIPMFSIHEFYLVWNDPMAGELTMNGFIYKASMVLFDGRMRGLFTILFGAGIMLFIENKKTNSIQIADAYFRRMSWLLIFGLIDSYLLLWTGDVLFEYALCGIFIYVLRNVRVRYMLMISAICLGTFTFFEGKGFSKFKDDAKVYLETEELLKKGKSLSTEQQATRDEFVFGIGHVVPFSDTVITVISKEIAESFVTHRSGYLSILEKHAEEVYDYQSNVFYSIFGETFGTILIGMALFKLGFFHGRLKPKVYWLIAIFGIGIGLSLVAWSIKLQAHSISEVWDAYHHRNFSTVYLKQPGRILSTLGYAALIYLLTQAVSLKRLLGLFANVGRMALTNYIMQTVLCSFYFFGFGLGHFGDYHARGLLLFVVCIWIIQITYSAIYLRYFQIGPLEWVWKRLTYGKITS